VFDGARGDNVELVTARQLVERFLGGDPARLVFRRADATYDPDHCPCPVDVPATLARAGYRVEPADPDGDPNELRAWPDPT
jgi:hypothetical protein